jgi:hypothetical protein
MRCAQRTAAEIADLDGGSGLGAVKVCDIARENPRMAGSDAVGRFSADAGFVLRMACRRRMRSSVEGWVENKLPKPMPSFGLMMKRCAVEGVASIGMRLE